MIFGMKGWWYSPVSEGLKYPVFGWFELSEEFPPERWVVQIPRGGFRYGGRSFKFYEAISAAAEAHS